MFLCLLFVFHLFRRLLGVLVPHLSSAHRLSPPFCALHSVRTLYFIHFSRPLFIHLSLVPHLFAVCPRHCFPFVSRAPPVCSPHLRPTCFSFTRHLFPVCSPYARRLFSICFPLIPLVLPLSGRVPRSSVKLSVAELPGQGSPSRVTCMCVARSIFRSKFPRSPNRCQGETREVFPERLARQTWLRGKESVVIQIEMRARPRLGIQRVRHTHEYTQTRGWLTESYRVSLANKLQVDFFPGRHAERCRREK